HACFEAEAKVQTLRGKQLDVILSIVFPDFTSSLSRVLVSMIDITERKRIEEKLKESENLYSTMANSSPIGVFIIQDGKFVFVNRQFCKMSGYAKNKLIGLESLSLVHTEDRDMVRENAIKMLKGQAIDSYEYRFISKNGKIRIILETIASIRYQGKRACLGNYMDISERKQAQEMQERLSQQLQAKVSELETFSYGIAHDLRSPLVSIEGFSRELRTDIQNRETERVQEDIRLLESGVSKMNDFLSRTLEYSRSGQLIKRTNNVSFGKIVNEVIAGFGDKISSIGATVSTARTFPRVCADRMRIVQVMTNLIQNSIKYRDKTRPLEIEIGYRLSKGETIFFVSDNGIGISDSEKEKLFTLFYRGIAEAEGSGIGLAIVKKIIEAHEGRLWVESQLGQGTTICFVLSQKSERNKGDNNGKD
ncbi:MAG: PAS domain S-box protein, partial [Dehalococcoidales bacterium]|nr:PAS domain S-box protein [Dehalococcoidales bacterium]